MSGIRGKDTKPELLVRQLLFKAGYRFRLHRKELPGTPDIVLPRRRIAIFIHGCFWHRHHECPLAKLPKSNTEFWRAKLSGNEQRDRVKYVELAKLDWRVLVVWECAFRQRKNADSTVRAMIRWIDSGNVFAELPSTSSS